MKKILIPLELNINNRANLLAVLKISAQFNSRITILHCSSFTFDDAVSELYLKQKLSEKKSELIEDINYRLQDSPYSKEDNHWSKNVSFKIVFGKFQSEIEKELNQEDYDLISFSIPFETNDLIELTGKELNRILNKINTTSLLIPENLGVFNPNQIIYCTNLERIKKSDEFLSQIKSFSIKFNSVINFLHVSMDKDIKNIQDKETFGKIKRLEEINSGKYKFKFEFGEDVFRVVKKHVQNKNIGLITAIKQNRGFFNSLFHDSFTNNICLFIKEPILIFHE